jgi:hypothetical protein
MKSSKAKENLLLERALKLLREHGYVAKKQINYTKKTFEVAVPTLERFKITQEALGLKIKDAMDEALKQWSDSKEAEVAKRSKK